MQADEFQALVSGLENMGLTKPQIADGTGLSQNTIWRFAHGRVSEPKHKTVDALERLHQRTVANQRPPLPAKASRA